MPLPAIAPYSVDVSSWTDRNVTSWSLDPTRATVLVHDMQEHFVNAFDRSDPNAQINRAVLGTAQILSAARAAGAPVVYTAQPPAQDLRDRALLLDFWGEGLQDDDAASIVEEVTPTSSDIMLTKWRYSAFYRSDLRERMRVRSSDQLIVTGVYAHIGCLTTALVAFMEGIQVFFVADAMADFSAEDHAMAARYVASRCGQVVTTAQVVETFAG